DALDAPAVEVDVEAAAVGLTPVVDLEAARGLRPGVDATPVVARVAHHRDAVEAEPIDVARARGDAARLPAPAALDIDAAVAVMAPRARRHDEAVTGVAELSLE